MWVSPFRNLRIKAYLQLPAAYRSLSRLSSAPSAKAFALRPYSLDRFYGFPFRSRHSIFLILFRSCLLHPSQIHKVFTHSSASPEKKSSSKSSFLRSSRKSNPLILHLPTKKFSVFEIAVSNYIYFLSFAVTIQFSRCNLEVFLLNKKWWAQVDSNHRPRAYQARALTT